MMVDPSSPLRLGSTAPDFSADSTCGPISSFHQFLGGKWAVLFSHPEDFTPVCTTELGSVAMLNDEWAKRNVIPVALSSHLSWVKDIEQIHQVKVDFPIIADPSRRVATIYRMLDHLDHDPSNMTPLGMPWTVRSVFIIDADRKIRAIITYPATTGRSFIEILRVIDSLQIHDRVGVSTPAEWKPCMDCIAPPSMSTKEAEEQFGHVREVKSYLRFVKSKL